MSGVRKRITDRLVDKGYKEIEVVNEAAAPGEKFGTWTATFSTKTGGRKSGQLQEVTGARAEVILGKIGQLPTVNIRRGARSRISSGAEPERVFSLTNPVKQTNVG